MIRYDQTFPITSVERTPTGGLRMKANMSMVGVFPYQLADGTTRHEYRPPEEVFHPDTLASFVGVPVTDGHPDDFVNPENHTALAKGHALSVDAVPPYMVGKLDVNDAGQIQKIVRGDAKELSMGYAAEYDPTPGVTPDGIRYDGRQTKIRGNHAAMGPAGWGRQGPTVALRLDSGFCIVDGTTPKEGAPIMTIHRIDGIDYEAGTPAHIAAVEKAIATTTKLASDAVTAAETARKDAADAKTAAVAELAKARKDAAERVKLVALGTELKAKGKLKKFDADEIPAEGEGAGGNDKIVSDILAEVAPGLDTGGWSPDQMGAGLKVAFFFLNGAAEAAPETPAADAHVAPVGAPASFDSARTVRGAPATPPAKERSEEQAREDKRRRDAAKYKQKVN